VSILSRLWGHGSRDRTTGVRLEDRNAWEVPAPRQASALFRALPILLPSGGFVYFEDTTEAIFASWARAHAVPGPLKITRGTIWPKPDYFHVPIEPAILEQAATLIDEHGIALPSIHVHAHDGTGVVLEWYDAFMNDPMRVASDVPRERVEAFANCMQVGPVSRDVV